MGKHRNCVTAHAQRRANERYGVLLNLDEVRRQIEAGEAQVIERESRTVLKVIAMGVPLVYNTVRNVVVTVLPDNSAEMLRYKAKLLLPATT